MKRFALLAVAAILGTAGYVRAEAHPADTHIAHAEGLYGDLRFEDALKVLDRALAVRDNSHTQLVRVYLLRGICLASIGRYREAKQSFARLLALDPTFRLDKDIAPRVRAPFQELLKKPPRLEVRLLPPPAAVKGKPIVFVSQVKADSVGMVRHIRVWFRQGVAGGYKSVRADLRGEGETRIPIPVVAWEGKAPGGNVSWYAMVLGENDGNLKRFGDALHPLELKVVDEPTPAGGPVVSRATPWYSRWWFWTIVGGVVAAGATTAVLLSTSGDSAGPHDFGIDILVNR